MMGDIHVGLLWILYYKNRLCVCTAPFYFKCLFHSSYWADLNQSWQVDGYTMPEYESKKLGRLKCAALSYFPCTASACFFATPGPISTLIGALLETPCENVNMNIQDY